MSIETAANHNAHVLDYMSTPAGIDFDSLPAAWERSYAAAAERERIRAEAFASWVRNNIGAVERRQFQRWFAAYSHRQMVQFRRDIRHHAS